jgi:uncharacterized phage protein gp47/JayE
VTFTDKLNKIMTIRTNYTEEEYYELMRDNINQHSNRPSDWSIGSIARSLFRSIAYVAEFIQLQINIAYLSFSVATAKGLHLDRRMADYNLTRREATYTDAIVTFFRDSGYSSNIIIPAGTSVSTDADFQGIIRSYELISSVLLSSGVVSASGIVRCTDLGAIGNIPSGKIVNIDSVLSGVSGVINYAPATSGSDLEDDNSFRARLPAYLAGLQGSTTASIKSAVYAIGGITYVKVAENSPALGNFTVYVSNDSGIIDQVTFDRINEAVADKCNICVTYTIIAPSISNITISFDVILDTDTYDTTTLIYAIQNQIKNFVNNRKISTLYISDIIAVAKEIDGVIDVNNVKINNISSDLSLSELYIAKINDVADISITVE